MTLSYGINEIETIDNDKQYLLFHTSNISLVGYDRPSLDILIRNASEGVSGAFFVIRNGIEDVDASVEEFELNELFETRTIYQCPGDLYIGATYLIRIDADPHTRFIIEIKLGTKLSWSY